METEVESEMAARAPPMASAADDSSDDDGPQPLPSANMAEIASGGGHSNYGGNLLPGEGAALAEFVKQNVRIPRRGEIGFDEKDIEGYEKSGFVMSGSRHAAMNAVRIRKENQVYTEEEKKALALITYEENQQKETALMEDFRAQLLERKRAQEKQEKDKKKEKKGK